MRFIIIALITCITNAAYSQKDTIAIRFIPTYASQPIETGKKYPLKNDSVEIETLRFYISGIRFYLDDKLVDEVEKKHHLVDIEKPGSELIYHISSKQLKFNRLFFNIGVDSITNESGVYGGDLDPINGMYWEWRSGYINLKLEGKTRICPARKNQFAFHIGGYQYPYNTIQQLNLPVADNQKIIVDFNVSDLLNQVDISALYEVMSPNEKAMQVAKKIGACFSITQ